LESRARCGLARSAVQVLVYFDLFGLSRRNFGFIYRVQ
jgi:hypothetical protein